jgi:deazaflavin-dependent oxidoreductase (nitroreductase family)
MGAVHANNNRPGRRTKRPNLLLRMIFRFPRWLYDARLGWIFGHRALLLTHRGRKSGLLHETALEVIRYERATDTSVVISAWGERSDWFRNIQHSPALQIETGGRRYVPEQRLLTTDEAVRQLERYAVEHRIAAKILERVFGFQITAGDEQRRAFAETIRMVAFRPCQPINRSPK